MNNIINHKSGAVSKDGGKTFSYRGWTIIRNESVTGEFLGYLLISESGYFDPDDKRFFTVWKATAEIDRRIYNEWAEEEIL